MHVHPLGNEYCALVLSTAEPLREDGYPAIDASKSLCNPYVFNTAITRAESLVVAVGNPFLLLKTEKHMVDDYKHKGKCWSNFLRHCIENNTISFCKSLRLTQDDERIYRSMITGLAEEHLGISIKVN